MFGRGKIDISIQKTSYAPGDTICGSIDLTLKKAVRAREMTMSLIGEYMTTQTRRLVQEPGFRMGLSTGSVSRRWLMSEPMRKSAPKYDSMRDTKTVRICPFKEQLDGEGEYCESRRYHFEIKIPAETPTSSVVKWHLLAELDVRHGLDVTKKVRITIA